MIEHPALRDVYDVPWQPHNPNMPTPLRQQVIARDNWTCQCCGHATTGSEAYPTGYMEVHHLDGNHHNEQPDNTVTVCPVCHDTLHSGMATASIRVTTVWVPELTQTQINQLAISLFMRMSQDDSDSAKQAVALYDHLSARAEEASKRLGNEVLNISGLATALTLLPRDSPDRDHLAGLRLLPASFSFDRPARYWVNNPGHH